MVAPSSDAFTSNAAVARPQVTGPVAGATFSLHVDRVVVGQQDGQVTVNGDPFPAPLNVAHIGPGVTLELVAEGDAIVRVGPDATGATRRWWGRGGSSVSSSSGTTLIYRALWWQLCIGFLLVIAGGIGGMYFGTHTPGARAQGDILKCQAGIPQSSNTSSKSDKTNGQSNGDCSSNAAPTSTTPAPDSGTTAPGSTASAPSTAGPTTSAPLGAGTAAPGAETTTTNPATATGASGGTTSSTVSLAQSLALAMIAAGATMIPTGGVGILAAKIRATDV